MGVSTHFLSFAAKQLNIPFTFIDPAESVLVLHFPQKDHFVINTKLGLITNAEETLGLDKAYQYKLLEGKVPMPATKTYLDPASKYKRFAEFSTQSAIRNDIQDTFHFPLIIKMNRGSEGDHVFLVSSATDLEEKIKTIFNQQDSLYDYVLLAQEYVKPVKEYRVVVYKQEIAFAYSKDNSQSVFSGNLSPLHWENAKAVDVTNEEKLLQLNEVCQKLFAVWPLKYGGLDIIEDESGKMWLIEVNTAPSMALYVQNCGESNLLQLYTRILRDLAS